MIFSDTKGNVLYEKRKEPWQPEVEKIVGICIAKREELKQSQRDNMVGVLECILGFHGKFLAISSCNLTTMY